MPEIEKMVIGQYPAVWARSIFSKYWRGNAVMSLTSILDWGVILVHICYHCHVYKFWMHLNTSGQFT